MAGMQSLKRVAKALGSPVIDATGIYESRIRKLARASGSWTIVMYHRVIADAALDPFRLGMCVTRARFAAQIRYLRSTFNVLTVREAIRRLDDGQPLPQRALSVTFDDGYLDTLTCALPVLQAHGVPFTLFIPTGDIESGRRLWWDRVIDAAAATRHATLDLDALGLPGTVRTLALDGPRRAENVEQLLALLWDLPAKAQLDAVERIEQQLQRTDSSGSRRLDPRQVQQLHRDGVEIGAHSVNHPNLRVASGAEVRHEMEASRGYLEQLVQEPIVGFAYPGGRMSAATAAIARDVGFRYSLGTVSAVNRAPFERFDLRRIGMPDAPLPDFRRAFSAAMARAAAVPAERF
jgi:peptidoglycan/xylan/chitin deacetylase (PgdA/CDA1 family)